MYVCGLVMLFSLESKAACGTMFLSLGRDGLTISVCALFKVLTDNAPNGGRSMVVMMWYAVMDVVRGWARSFCDGIWSGP